MKMPDAVVVGNKGKPVSLSAISLGEKSQARPAIIIRNCRISAKNVWNVISLGMIGFHLGSFFFGFEIRLIW